MPYGNLTANSGWVNVGADHDTRHVRSGVCPPLVEWSRALACPHATRLLITADGGGLRRIPLPPAWLSPSPTSHAAPPGGTRSSTGLIVHSELDTPVRTLSGEREMRPERPPRSSTGLIRTDVGRSLDGPSVW